MKKFLFIILVLSIVILACGATPTEQSGPVSGNTEPVSQALKNDPTATQKPTNIPLPNNSPVPADIINPPTATIKTGLIKPGTHLVGTDIQPGIYWGNAGQGLFNSCYWERMSDLSGSFDAIIANDNAEGQFYLEVKPTDKALKVDCEIYPLSSEPSNGGTFPTIIEPGTYLVGVDIQPGTYKGQAGADIMNSCYWERLSNVAGDIDGIIANENATGQFYVAISASDFAFNTGCPLEWISE